jgi:[acyl-carrier-protein] S-malonyltransferase
MQRAQARLGEILERTEFKDPQVPFVSSVTGEIVTSGKTIRELMARQVTSTVQWVKSIQTMISNGVGEFYEFGPGKVLSGLVSRIDTNVRCHSIEETDDIQ